MIPLLAALALVVSPQDPATRKPSDPLAFERLDSGARVRADAVEGTRAVTVWLCVAAGSDHDPADEGGIARVLGEALREELPDPAPERPVDVVVMDRATLVGVLLPPDELTAHLARVGRWLGGELDVDDDGLLRARGRALLRADDELEILPGPILRERAERLLLAGTPAARPSAGDPAVIRALEPAAIRRAFARAFHPSRATVAMLGALRKETALEAARAAFGAPVEHAAEPLPPVAAEAADVEEIERETPAERVDAPFVAFGFQAPAWGEADYLPFLIAMEVVRSRAASTFRGLRGGEVLAEFPPVAYDFLRMPPLAFLERRGRNGEPASMVHAELDSLIAGLRSGGAGPQEVQAALGALLETLAVPPFRKDVVGLLGTYPTLLHQRGYVVAAYGLHGWPADLRAAIGSVPIGRVDRVLAAALAPERGVRVALVPNR